MAFGGFLAVLVQNVLLKGSQCFLPPIVVRGYIVGRILFRIVIEIMVEKKRRELKLPLKLPKLSNLFKKQPKQDFVFKRLSIRRKKFKIFSRELKLPVFYEKEIIIRESPKVKPIYIT